MVEFLDNNKPCPFCGSDELRGKQVDDDCFVIECQNCITIFEFPGHVKGTALQLWNDRREVESELTNDVLDKCISLLDEYKQKMSQSY